MRAVVLHEYGGPEKLKFEDNVPSRNSGGTVLTRQPRRASNPMTGKLRSGMVQKNVSVVVSGNSGPRCEWRRKRAVGANVSTLSPATAFGAIPCDLCRVVQWTIRT